MIDQRETDDSSEPTLANDPMDRIEKAEPIEPIEPNDPMEPIESIEFFDPMLRNEPSDQRDHFEVEPDSLMSLSIMSHSPAITANRSPI